MASNRLNGLLKKVLVMRAKMNNLLDKSNADPNNEKYLNEYLRLSDKYDALANKFEYVLTKEASKNPSAVNKVLDKYIGSIGEHKSVPPKDFFERQNIGQTRDIVGKASDELSATNNMQNLVPLGDKPEPIKTTPDGASQEKTFTAPNGDDGIRYIRKIISRLNDGTPLVQEIAPAERDPSSTVINNPPIDITGNYKEEVIKTKPDQALKALTTLYEIKNDPSVLASGFVSDETTRYADSAARKKPNENLGTITARSAIGQELGLEGELGKTSSNVANAVLKGTALENSIINTIRKDERKKREELLKLKKEPINLILKAKLGQAKAMLGSDDEKTRAAGAAILNEITTKYPSIYAKINAGEY